MDAVIAYKPTSYYFRSALRNATTRERAVEIGLVVCAEHERLRAWVRAQGLTPPKWVVDPREASEKGWRNRKRIGG